MGVDMMHWQEQRLPEENKALYEQLEKQKADNARLRGLIAPCRALVSAYDAAEPHEVLPWVNVLGKHIRAVEDALLKAEGAE